MLPRALIAWLVGGLVLTIVAPCAAQDDEYGTPPEARAAFLQATELYERRAYARAELEFRRAWELMEGHPRRALVFINMARCVEAQPGREREALRMYEQALQETNALAADDPSIREGRRIAEERVAELNARFAAIEASANAPPDEMANEAPERAAAGGAGVHPLGPIVLAVGGAMLLAGGISGGVALAEHEGVVAMCDASAMTCPAELRGRANEVAAVSIAADVLLWGGLAVAAVGVVLTIVLPNGGDAPAVAASCGPTGCAAVLTGSF